MVAAARKLGREHEGKKKKAVSTAAEMKLEEKPVPNFLEEVAQMATLAEEAICKLRTETHRDNFQFKDLSLSYLFPQKIDSIECVTTLENVVTEYLRQTMPYGLGEANFRAGNPLEENTSTYAHTANAWKSQVYTARKAEIDKMIDESFHRIIYSANHEIADMVFKLGMSSKDPDSFLNKVGRLKLSSPEQLEGEKRAIKTVLYQIELPRPEFLDKLYEMCFKAEVKQRGWEQDGDKRLAKALAQENVSLEMFAKYTGREIKLSENDAETALASRTGSAGSQRRSSQVLILDPASAENNAVENQEQWIVYWNNITDGRRFASMADYYQVFKQLTDALQNGSPAEKASAEQSIASLRKDFQESYLLTSTRIIYQPNNLEARLIHGYGAVNPQQTSEIVLPVPLYWETPIASVYAAREGLTYLQALFNTEDSGQAIAERLSAVSGYQPQDIKLWTPPLQSDQWLTRSQLSERAVGLCSGRRGFHLGADGRPVGYRDRSRGVR